MELDFQTFQINLLLSLKQQDPLDENLRAVMAPALSKLRRYSRALVALHAFINPELHELHTMILGTSCASHRAVDHELRRRNDYDLKNLTPRAQLPFYRRIVLPIDSGIPKALNREGDIHAENASSELIEFFEKLRRLDPEEFPIPFITEDDTIILIPLETGLYNRLGCIILWAPSGTLTKCVEPPSKRERLIAFRKSIEKLLVRLFTNFYQMEPHTYLPSYHQVEQKSVALLCMRIREFDHISEVLRLRRDMERQEATECLRRLVSSFSETASAVVEKNRGRVDQIWGNGLLAVFGEYLDVPDTTPHPSCTRAVIAAAEFVEKFDVVADMWLKNDFKGEKFKGSHNELITLTPAVAVDYGEVIFDYVGSPKYRVYMAVGDHVNFVKQLAEVAGSTQSIDNNTRFLLRRLEALMHGVPPEPSEQPAPIFLSQAAYTWARHILKGRKHTLVGTVHRAQAIYLPGKITPYAIYELWPDNIDRTAS